MNEISRITQLYEKVNFKKNKYKKEVREINQNFEREKERFEKDIQYFREKVLNEKFIIFFQFNIYVVMFKALFYFS